MACTPVQDSAVGPPGAAHAVMTCRAWSTLAVFSTAASIAASCATAPSGGCGNPDGIPTGPVLVEAGSTIAPGSRTDSVEGCALLRSDLASGAAARASRRARTCSMESPDATTAPPGAPFGPDTEPGAGLVVASVVTGCNRSHTHSTTPATR